METLAGARLSALRRASLALAFPLAGYAQQAPAGPTKPPANSELIAVLDLEAVGPTSIQASTLTDRLREELLKSGKFTLVDRSQMNELLKEQAFLQCCCFSQECAVQAGKVLGARKIVTGWVTKLDERRWLLAATMIDVETSQTLRAESFRYEGEFFSMLDAGIAQLAAKLGGGESTRPKL